MFEIKIEKIIIIISRILNFVKNKYPNNYFKTKNFMKLIILQIK